MNKIKPPLREIMLCRASASRNAAMSDARRWPMVEIRLNEEIDDRNSAPVWGAPLDEGVL